MNVPSGYTALDLIGFTDRGNYDSTANYVKNDLVHHNNSIWKCLVDDTTAVTPAEGANWTVYIQNGTTLNGMADVNLTTPANGDLLRYNSTSSKWENQDVDSTPTQSSTKLVQSGGVYTQLAGKADTADLATVATTGAYSDLSGAPQLAAVATSGAYSDLTGQPTIPTVNDATLTIQKNGTNVETFTANSSTNKTANITVPDVINDLSDVNISSVANEEILVYDSTLSKWKNSGALGALKETLTNEVTTRATLGAHNLFNSSNVLELTANTTATPTATGITVKSSSSNTYLYAKYTLVIDKNTDYIFKASYTVNSGAARVVIEGVTGGTATAIKDTGLKTSSSTMTLPFNSGNYDSYDIKFYCSGSPAAIGNIDYTNVLLMLATDPDTTYRPYVPTNSQLLSYKDNGMLGAKNLLPMTLSSIKEENTTGTWSGNVYTKNGVSFEVLTDAKENVTGIKVNGTATAEFVFSLTGRFKTTPSGRFVINGIVGGSSTTYDIYSVMRINGVMTYPVVYNGDSSIITLSESDVVYNVGIRLRNGCTLSNQMFYPMIRLASDPDSTYVPYAMTNKELTDELSSVSEVANEAYTYRLKIKYIELPSASKVPIRFSSTSGTIWSIYIMALNANNADHNIAVLNGRCLSSNSSYNKMQGRYIVRNSNFFISYSDSDSQFYIVNKTGAMLYIKIVDMFQNFWEGAAASVGTIVATTGSETNAATMKDLAIIS